MINYEIVGVDPVQRHFRVKFTKEGKQDAYYQEALPDEYNDAYLHERASLLAEQAVQLWQRVEDVGPYTVETPTGQLKDLVVEDEPEYEMLFEKLEPVYTEDETTKYKGWRKVAYSVEEKAFNIRRKRNQLLAETDQYALADRTMSSEMTTYRTDLRNVTDQETFPNSIIWPIKPI